MFAGHHDRRAHPAAIASDAEVAERAAELAVLRHVVELRDRRARQLQLVLVGRARVLLPLQTRPPLQPRGAPHLHIFVLIFAF